MVVWAPTGEDPQGDGISPFPAKSRKYGSNGKSISQRIILCALPKTKPVGDDLRSTALWPTDDDDDIKSKSEYATKFEKCKFIFIKTFSLLLPSSLLKLPNARKWTPGGGGGEAGAQLKIDWCI